MSAISIENHDAIYSALCTARSANKRLYNQCRHVDDYEQNKADGFAIENGFKALEAARLEAAKEKVIVVGEVPDPDCCYCAATPMPPCGFCEKGIEP